jgi:hypothetical protein
MDDLQLLASLHLEENEILSSARKAESISARDLSLQVSPQAGKRPKAAAPKLLLLLLLH